MNDELGIWQIFDIVKKRIVLIIFCAIIGLLLSGIITFKYISPKYASQSQLIVTLSKDSNVSATDVTMNLQMINTYKDLIAGDLVMEQVSAAISTKYNIEVSASTLRGLIQVNQSNNSQMFSIRATTENPELSKNIANITAKVFQNNVKKFLNIESIAIVSNAKKSIQPVSPNKKMNLLLGLVAGMVVGVTFSLVLNYMDRTVKDETFILEVLHYQLLGSIPEYSHRELVQGKYNISKDAKTRAQRKRGSK